MAQPHSVEEYHIGYLYCCLFPHFHIQGLQTVSLCYGCRQQPLLPPWLQWVLLASLALCHSKKEPQQESRRELVASELLK